MDIYSLHEGGRIIKRGAKPLLDTLLGLELQLSKMARDVNRDVNKEKRA